MDSRSHHHHLQPSHTHMVTTTSTPAYWLVTFCSICDGSNLYECSSSRPPFTSARIANHPASSPFRSPWSLWGWRSPVGVRPTNRPTCFTCCPSVCGPHVCILCRAEIEIYVGSDRGSGNGDLVYADPFTRATLKLMLSDWLWVRLLFLRVKVEISTELRA